MFESQVRYFFLKVAHVGRFFRKGPNFVDSNLKIKDTIQ